MNHPNNDYNFLDVHIFLLFMLCCLRLTDFFLVVWRIDKSVGDLLEYFGHPFII